MATPSSAAQFLIALLTAVRQVTGGRLPPFGYATVVKERRGNKNRRILVVKEDEASLA